ncbi:MAG TPA: CYTH domain-containing protein [Candidatus Saccharimonadales bacterium]|nr:CYTH domain-containing protein [Candidatus Saccharimonadales bacterium]
MPEEREIKIPVGVDFVLPDLDDVVDGTTAVDRGSIELSATYWDTDDLTLLQATLGLRHRSAPGEPGKWTLKAGARMVGQAVSREETDFPGPPGQPPQAAIDVIRAVVGDVELHPVAQLVTARHTVDLVAGDVRRAEVADDRVAVRSGDTTVETFREVEVELFDVDEQLIGAVMTRLRTAGVGEPDSTPKYVRALLALGHRIPGRTAA